MLKDVEWSEDGTYAPQGEHTPIEFFNNALKNSYLFDLELGYFNSAAISVLAGSFATFIRNGGIMRMAINHIVSQKDKMAIEAGENGKVDLPFDITNIHELRKSLDEYGDHFFRCLSYLIQEHRIQIRIIKPKGTQGISHTKRGQFCDGDTTISFTGSANFTLGGFFNNREEITLSFSYSPDTIVQKRIANRKEEFNVLMAGNDDSVEYLRTTDLEEAIRTEYGKTEIEELLDVEKKLKSYKIEKENENQKVEEDNSYTYNSNPVPSFPYGKPRDYQHQAFLNWKDNKQKGLFAMATGTGKTITSLNCLLEIYKRKGYYKAIILVPTITLVNQWEEECRKFRFNNIIKVYSKSTGWRNEIARLKYNELHCDNTESRSYIFITTYASYSKEAIFNLLNSFNAKQLLLIADECHNIGSETMLKRIKTIPYLRRIGLSATPKRQFDDKGNAKIERFFGIKEEYTFEYTMQQAIRNGVLCRYYYYPHLVTLTRVEMDKYSELSLKIAKYFNYNTGAFDKKDDILTALLLARKRLIHKAANKLDVFKHIIDERYKEKGSLKYTLVYVPEGNEPDYYENECTECDSAESADDIHLIDQYTSSIASLDPLLTVCKFTSGIKDRDEILKSFAKGDIQVLTSMKCLDEGVDVPRSELAIFCSSTGNPRQFIQRRGRILRVHKDKARAYIHDLVVMPEVNSTTASYQMERALLKKELERVKDFSMLSENSGHTQEVLSEVMEYYNLNLYKND